MSGRRIEDYGLIGDGETAALVDRRATIEWLCMPRFDSPACFAALLGDDENGCWRMAPSGGAARVSRRYVDDTLILETTFEREDGEVLVTDFMPIRGAAPDIVRIVEGRRGRVEMCSELMLRFDYGRTHPLVRRRSATEILAIAGPNAVAIHADREIECGDRRFVSEFEIAEGERACFVMTWFRSHDPAPSPVDALHALEQTRAWWRDWISRSTYEGSRRTEVARSLITLKALVYRPTGGMVAAPTLGLPEWPQGRRNWDYRYCWLRDATFTLLVFLDAGFREEAKAWLLWLRRAVAGEPIDLQPLYAVSGDRLLPEWEASWLDGFDGARPVLVGNAADVQHQLDVYGEVIDTLFFARRHGIDGDGDTEDLMRLLVDRLEAIWREPGAGIWESRGPPRRHVYSAVMCWVAFDRAARWLGADDRALRTKYQELAARVKADVLGHGFDPAQNSFVRAFDDPALDASNLRLPLVGFLPADDPRICGTVAAVERRLMRDGFVLRYLPEDVDDGVGGDEGAFFACTLWLADVYILQDRHKEAQALLDRVCAAANDLGLLAEQILPSDGRFLGNFPQALSHLALVDTALDLRGRGGPAQERGRQA